MLRYALFAFGASLAIGLPQHAVAQSTVAVGELSLANQSCYNPDTDGASNEAALPLCEDYLEQASGAERYATIDRGTLAETRICPAGVDCGPPADLTNVRPFYGTAGQPVPASVAQPVAVAPAPPPPAPVALAPPAPVAVPPAPAAFSPITAALPGAGLGGVGFAAAGLLAVAAGVGVVALANDSDSTPSTD